MTSGLSPQRVLGAIVVLCAIVVAAPRGEPVERVQTSGRPDVLVIVADDQGWGDLSLHGNTAIATPRLDALAREGARFERFFVQPLCAPTRAELLTGRYHPRGSVTGVSTGAERLDVDERTIAAVFRAAGYATAAFGKWHTGTQPPYHPNSRGFDEFHGFTSGHWAHYFDAPMDHNGQLVTGRGYMPDDLTDRALAFLATQRASPAFVLLGYAARRPSSRRTQSGAVAASRLVGGRRGETSPGRTVRCSRSARTVATPACGPSAIVWTPAARCSISTPIPVSGATSRLSIRPWSNG